MQFLPKHCGQCALRNPSQQVCQITGWSYEDKDPACKNFCNHLSVCEYCGRAYPSIMNILDERLICEDCLNATGTCRMCEFAKTCDFETNPSTLPKVVQKVVQQGNMQMATQVRNPERKKITCEAGCKCYDEEYGCSRQNSLCINYIFRQKS